MLVYVVLGGGVDEMYNEKLAHRVNFRLLSVACQTIISQPLAPGYFIFCALRHLTGLPRCPELLVVSETLRVVSCLHVWALPST